MFTDGVIPVFSESYVQWDGTTLTYGDATYTVGDTLEGGGGDLLPADKIITSVTIPAACTGGPYAVLNPPHG